MHIDEADLSDMEHCVSAEWRKERDKVLKTKLPPQQWGDATDQLWREKGEGGARVCVCVCV